MSQWNFVYCSPKGRIGRKTYWLYSIPLVLLILQGAAMFADSSPDLYLLLVLALMVPSMMINIKRSHDRGRSGWFTVLLFIPLISLWPMIEFGFLRGTAGPNRYGDAVV